MATAVSGVHPTRMELLKAKRKTKLAKKGHKLLKEKRDALIMEFFNVVKKAKGTRCELATTLTDGYDNLIKAESVIGSTEVHSIASTVEDEPQIEMKISNVMGVRIPRMTIANPERGGKYGLMFTTSKLDDSVKNFNTAVEQIVNLIEIEETIKRLSSEIKKTKRRVNSLEYVMVPRLEATQRYIRMRLEEMERENFFRLKTVKRKKMKS